MRIPAIEELKSCISDPRTKQAMDEGLSCYYSNNLRSAVVMLYATVVSDLFYKLYDLKEYYNHTGARQIVEEYQQKKTENHKDTSWETYIPKKCEEMKIILSSQDLVHFEALQKERHLCAHPIITDDMNLYQPNPSTVQGLIIDMMRGILCKPAFLTKELVPSILNTIGKRLAAGDDSIEIAQNVWTQKLQYVSQEKDIYKIFRELWKLAFLDKDDEDKTRRGTIFNLLGIIYEKNKTCIQQQIKQDDTFFIEKTKVDIIADKDFCSYIQYNTPLYQLILFLNNNPSIFAYFPKELKKRINKNIVESKRIQDITFFDVPHDQILQTAKERIEGTSTYVLRAIIDYVKATQTEADFREFLIKAYIGAISFDNADLCFRYIEPYIKSFSVEQLIEIMKGSNENSQLYKRRDAARSNKIVLSEIKNRGTDFETSIYANLQF